MLGRQWRALELDGQVLLFDRLTGTNMLVTNESTARLRRVAPRMLQVALTNACDKSCSFCYRSRCTTKTTRSRSSIRPRAVRAELPRHPAPCPHRRVGCLRAGRSWRPRLPLPLDWLAEHKVDGASIRLCEYGDLAKFGAIAKARCPACQGVLEYLDPRVHGIDAEHLACGGCGGMFEMKTFLDVAEGA